MNQDVKYSGFAAVPADYECPDGQLAVSINCLPENGALQPVLPPKPIKKFDDDSTGRISFIHKTSSFTHYIVYIGNLKIFYFSSHDSDTEYPLATLGGVKHFNAVGNVLMAFTDTSIHYYLWKNDSYSYLGDHLPNLEFSFGLRGKPRLFSMNDESKSTFKVTFNSISADNLFEQWSESNQTKITSQVMAKVNKFLADQTIRKGRFALPFFVRYALRLYDGSLTCHSAPILMNPSTKAAPVVLWTRAKGKESYTEANCDIMLVSAGLDYKLIADADEDYKKLADWSDIVKSVDVFISKPIYTYDQEGLCKSFADTDNFDTKFIGALDFDAFAQLHHTDRILLPVTLDGVEMSQRSPHGKDSPLGYNYVEWPYSKLYALYFSDDRTYPDTTIMLPEHSEGKNKESLHGVSQFYLLRSIELSDLSTTERKDIVVDNEYLQSLVTREVMTDDYLSHDGLSAQYSHNYNARLNLSGVKRNLFRGFHAGSMLAYCNSREPDWTTSGSQTTLSFKPFGDTTIQVDVYVRENGGTFCVSSNCGESLCYFLSGIRYTSQADKENATNAKLSPQSWGCYVFYPNPNAFKMILRDNSGAYEINLKPHEYLNGAFAVLDYETQREAAKSLNLPQVSAPATVDMPNKIYTSQVNNPFYFPLLGINTVGTGIIYGISSAAKALSEGQFGQFPLYAFTTEGVWALEVSSSGTYSARQPVTRDVCINPDGITQLDSAVLFPTKRGIMLLSGSNAQCISEPLNSEFPFNALALPHFRQLHLLLGLPHTQADTCLPTLPFSQFLAQCRMIYDYVHQRIIVYAPGITYAYVYSMKSKQWGMTFSNIVSHLNSYPEALAVDNAGNIVNFSETDAAQVGILYVTRALKFGQGSLLKTIDTVIQRGNFVRGHVATALYASRDLVNWHLVWSSKDHYLCGFRGTPYKYFRIAGVGRIDASENILGASVMFTPRQTNHLR